jgi:hypothetical protein
MTATENFKKTFQLLKKVAAKTLNIEVTLK